MNAPAEFDVDVAHIRNHYDRLSFWYRTLWGEHIHHGYWEDNESVARAQIQLMAFRSRRQHHRKRESQHHVNDTTKMLKVSVFILGVSDSQGLLKVQLVIARFKTYEN